MKKRIISTVCAALLVFSAAGCGSVKGNEADTAAVNAAVEKFAACKSFSVEQVTDSTEVAVAEGTQYKYEGSKSVEISLVKGDKFYMSTATETEVKAEEGSVAHSTASYLVPEGSGYTEYFSDGDKWYKLSTEDASLLPQIDAMVFAGSFYVDALSFAKTGEDTLDSGKALRYEGSLGGQELIGMLDGIGYFAGSIGSMSENQQAKIIANLEKDLKPVTVKVWIDEASGYPVKFQVSLTEMLKELEQSITKTLGNLDTSEWSITEYEITMTVSDFDSLDSIELPEEAKSAVVYNMAQGQAS